MWVFSVSLVRSVRVAFTEGVGAVAAGAFGLTGVGPGNVPITVGAVNAALAVDGRSVLLTFAGSGTEFGSLVDGRYTLTTDGSLITGLGGLALDADGDGTPGGTRTDLFHRFFGDSDGDGDTDGTDLLAFRRALGRNDVVSLALFDYDADGDVDGTDLGQFRKRLGRGL